MNRFVEEQFLDASPAHSSSSVKAFFAKYGTRFVSVEAVKAKSTEVLNKLSEADFQQWKIGMECCRDRYGEYIERDKLCNVVNKILCNTCPVI